MDTRLALTGEPFPFHMPELRETLCGDGGYQQAPGFIGDFAISAMRGSCDRRDLAHNP